MSNVHRPILTLFNTICTGRSNEQVFSLVATKKIQFLRHHNPREIRLPSHTPISFSIFHFCSKLKCMQFTFIPTSSYQLFAPAVCQHKAWRCSALYVLWGWMVNMHKMNVKRSYHCFNYYLHFIRPLFL